MAGALYIGTSGWSYRDWAGAFYPSGLPQRSWLPYYAQHFSTVELNSPFYRLPPRKTFAGWRDKVPPGFLFAVKASRFITHVKRLEDAAEPLGRLFEAVEGLGEKRGPILFQLPPKMKVDVERLAAFLAGLPKGWRTTFEFRHASWFRDEVYALLKQADAALCIASTPRYPLEVRATASYAYARLHGSKRLYASKYTEEELREWAESFAGFLRDGLDVYVYFDNDCRAYAVDNAQRLGDLLAEGDRAGGSRRA